MKRSTQGGFESFSNLALGLAALGLAACSTTPAPVTSHADTMPGMGETARAQSIEVAAGDPAAPQSDEQVTTAILAKLEKDPDPQVQVVGVSTARGIVTLTGNVSTAQARNSAVSIADDTAGVVRVRDDLVIASDVEDGEG